MKKTRPLAKIILLSLFLTVFALNISAQKVTLSFQNETFEKVLNSIKQQTGLSLVFSEQLVNLNRKVNINVNSIEVEDALKQLLTGTNLSYEIKNNKLYLVEKKNVEQKNTVTPSKKITGLVTDEKGDPIIGASVVLKGSNSGTITDISGNFTVDASSQSILAISYIGFLSKEVKVGAQNNFKFILVEDNKALEEVVVVGYGTQRKGNLTGSVSSLKSEKLTIAPVSNITNSLAGRLPGLVTKQGSGMPGADATDLRIRGFGNALVIVDGVEGNLNNIDANQIESLSILKDGAASVYGSRAGNGVILVTTKRGQEQKPIISLNTSFSQQGVTKILRPASSYEISLMQREAHIQSGKPVDTAPWSEEAIAKFKDGTDPAYPNTDWFKYTFRDWAPQQNHNLSIRGGSDKIKYYGFFGYTEQQTMVKTNGGNYSRYNVQSNIDAKISKQLSMTIDLSMANENRMFPIRGMNNDGYFWQDYYNTLPWYPSTLPDPTKVAWGGIDVGSIATVSNIDLMGYSSDKRQDLRGIVSFTYDFEKIKGLKAKALINYSDNTSMIKNFRKPISFYTYNYGNETYTKAASFNESNLSEGIWKTNMLTQQYSLNYNNTIIEDHRITALLLYETIDYKSNNFTAFRSNLLTPAIDQLFVGSTTGMGNNGSASEMGRVSYVGRLNYGYKNRYLLEAIFRADASAKFPKENRWGYFPSLSLGWVVTQENFMKKQTVFDNIKLRASYGESGNDAVGNFQFLSGYSVRGSAILETAQQPGMYSTGIANPYLTWENMKIINGGLDFSLFNQKLYGELEAFYRVREGIPATRLNSLPSTFGATLPVENINSLDDRGFEFMLGTRNKIGDFSYDISGNISWSRSKWIRYEEPEYTDPEQARVYKISGNWTDRVMGYVNEKLFETQQEINNLTYSYSSLGGNLSLRPGDVKFKDLNNDSILNWKDQKEIGSGTTPHWMVGFSIGLKYKNFDFSGLLQGAFGYNTNINLSQYANSEQFKLRWTEATNDSQALVPRLGGAGTNSSTSPYLYKATSYLRLKTVSFGYTVPKSILSKASIESLRVYMAGTNLFTLSSISRYGIDPETPSGTIMVYPQQRTVSFGINLSF